jgi:hypothetical protein
MMQHCAFQQKPTDVPEKHTTTISDPEDGHSTVLQNTGGLAMDYMVLHVRRQYSAYSVWMIKSQKQNAILKI